ncbi:MAG TPA: MGMT family protein [Candidatus Paceibacterota bacterium]
MQTFRDKVRCIVSKIKRGETLTYGEVARMAGNSRAARAVGAIMRANRSKSVPCHRVIFSDGGLGGYNRGGTNIKRYILKQEGAL